MKTVLHHNWCVMSVKLHAQRCAIVNLANEKLQLAK